MAVTFERHFDLNDDLNAGIGPALTYARSAAARHFLNNDFVDAAANVPRLLTNHFVGGGNRPRGLLLERGAENLMPDGDFNDAEWGIIRATKDEALAARGFLGTSMQDTVQVDNTYIILDNLTITDTVTYTFSWTARVDSTASTPFMFFTTNAVSGSPKQYFDVENGAPGATPAYDDRGVIDLGEGYFRFWITFTANEATGSKAMQIFMALADNVNSFNGDESHFLQLFDAQLELGVNPTTFTPNGTIRGAGTCTAALVPGATTTVYIEGVTNTGPGVILQIDDGTENERYRIERIADNSIIVTTTDGSAEQAAIDAGSVADGTFFRLACRFAANSFSASLDGAAAVTDGAGTLPTLTTLRVGHAFTAGGEWDNLIAKVQIQDVSVDDAGLVALSGSGAFAEALGAGAGIANVITDFLFEEAA